MVFNAHTIFIFSLISWCILELWVFKREWGQADKSKDKNTKRILLISAVIAAVLGNYFSNFSRFQIQGFRQIHELIGTIFVISGVLIRFWSIQTLGKLFRTTVMIQKGHTVIKSGPYRYLRHPSYTGILIAVIGVGIATGNWIGLILMIAIIFWGLNQRIMVEEKELSKTLGEEYIKYMRHTKKLLPFIY